MTDFLYRLVDRAIGSVPRVGPAIAPLFGQGPNVPPSEHEAVKNEGESPEPRIQLYDAGAASGKPVSSGATLPGSTTEGEAINSPTSATSANSKPDVAGPLTRFGPDPNGPLFEAPGAENEGERLDFNNQLVDSSGPEVTGPVHESQTQRIAPDLARPNPESSSQDEHPSSPSPQLTPTGDSRGRREVGPSRSGAGNAAGRFEERDSREMSAPEEKRGSVFRLPSEDDLQVLDRAETVDHTDSRSQQTGLSSGAERSLVTENRPPPEPRTLSGGANRTVERPVHGAAERLPDGRGEGRVERSAEGRLLERQRAESAVGSQQAESGGESQKTESGGQRAERPDETQKAESAVVNRPRVENTPKADGRSPKTVEPQDTRLIDGDQNRRGTLSRRGDPDTFAEQGVAGGQRSPGNSPSAHLHRSSRVAEAHNVEGIGRVAGPPLGGDEVLIPSRSMERSYVSLTPTSQRVQPVVAFPDAVPIRREAERAAPDSTAAPTIRVTIGRVEVRAVLPSQPPPEPAAGPPPPRMSLDDYLKSPNGGRR